ncbi:LOW QUALITY PROTEIN: hypothetical protein MAR_035547 [Mya arenaria]|uniref:Uncharacterized protein n=1 Tax=Mya arenaria TaxID=6604 RepID=A0ABY7ENR9_MYAAR|nr:LOW QUALITY PROTEIN: hypothetical protein MAR_035547 [Mya arenaria]
MLACRSSTNASTGVTPNKMEIILPLQANIGLPPDPDKACGSYSEYVSALHNELETIHKMAQKRNIRSVTMTLPPSVALSSKVMRFGYSTTESESGKLSPQWKGPCLVTGKIDDLEYFVKTSQRSLARPFHIDRLRLYRGSHKPAWLKI